MTPEETFYKLETQKGLTEEERFDLACIIATSGYYSYLYANSLKGRFILGEAAIANSPSEFYYYARDVLEGSFELGEKALKKNRYVARSYYNCPIIMSHEIE